jgi:hypothetical protein
MWVVYAGVLRRGDPTKHFDKGLPRIIFNSA